MPRNGVSVGVDLGGSWLRVAVAADGRLSRRLRLRAVTPAELPAELRRLFSRMRLRPRRLRVGSKGVWRAAERRRLRRALEGLAPEVEVLSDLELAHRAAFGSGPGVLIVAGTGSAVYGVDPCGHQARAGGLGPLLGDEGSAFWIGREWLKGRPERALRLARRPDAVRAVAALGGSVVRRAAGTPEARRIVAAAQNQLAVQARAAARDLHFRGEIPVAFQGGLLGQKRFRLGLLRLLGRRWKPAAASLPADVAAASNRWLPYAIDKTRPPCY